MHEYSKGFINNKSPSTGNNTNVLQFMNGLETLLHSCQEILLFSFKKEHISDPQSSLGTCVLSHFSHVQLFATPWTVAHQAPRSMGFSRQEYWGGLPFRSPGHLPNPGVKPGFLALQAGSLSSEPLGKSIKQCTGN